MERSLGYLKFSNIYQAFSDFRDVLTDFFCLCQIRARSVVVVHPCWYTVNQKANSVSPFDVGIMA
jgi:hypothetical protein